MHTHVPVVEGGGRVALCTTTGGSGGSRMSRRLDADEALPEAAGPPARDILGGGGALEGEEGRAVAGLGTGRRLAWGCRAGALAGRRAAGGAKSPTQEHWRPPAA